MSTQETSTGTPPAALDASVDRIGQQLHELQKTYSAIRNQTLLFSGLILIVMLLFGVALFNRMRENLSAEKLGDAAGKRALSLMPKAQEQLLIGLKDAAPTYRDLAMKRFQAALPALETKVSKLSETVPQQVLADMKGEADGVFKRVAQKLELDLEKEFPKLDHAKLVATGDKLTADLAVAGGELAKHLEELLHKELARIQGVLEGFPIDQYASVDNDKLSRLLVHHLLMLVDHEVQVAGTHEGIDQSAAVRVE